MLLSPAEKPKAVAERKLRLCPGTCCRAAPGCAQEGPRGAINLSNMEQGVEIAEGNQIQPLHTPEQHLFNQGKPQELLQGKDNPESSLKPQDFTTLDGFLSARHGFG